MAGSVAITNWATSRTEPDGLPGGGLNIAYETLDRHVAAGHGDTTALRCIDRAGRAGRVVSYRQLAAATARFANVLGDLGVESGERVFGLLGRTADVHVATLGTLRHGAVYCPLFAAFGPEPIRRRLAIGEARVLVTTASLYERKLADWIHDVDGLDHVLVLSEPGIPAPDGLDLRQALAAASPTCPPAATVPDDPALVHFTSGTTGPPKGAVHVHDAVITHNATAAWALDLHPGDVFWCTADPGWVTGTSYGVIAPLTRGVTCLVDEGELDARRWYRQLAAHQVTVWYTAPTALRMLMRAGPELARSFDLSALRLVASVGEALDADVVRWAEDTWGLPVHDTWWQTETGGIMLANPPSQPVRAGAMGRPVPGVDATVLRRDAHGRLDRDAFGRPVVCRPGETGELALRVGWPSMFRGYLGQPERYERSFVDGPLVGGDADEPHPGPGPDRWYLSGDLVRRDDEGWYWFVGRGDDVIKSAGHLIGPSEVESALLDHRDVAEAGVIGVPDPVIGEQVKAFVVLARGATASDELPRALRALARRRLGPALAPRTIEVRDTLPHTRSGKIMRRLLRAQELGLPEGDLSTLETACNDEEPA